MDGNHLRGLILEAIKELSPKNPYDAPLDSGSVLKSVARVAKLNTDEEHQALMTLFSDLFRSGHLAWGKNLMNPNPPFFFVTAIGREALRNLSRDPANPDGYLQHISEMLDLNPIAMSYLQEALQTYNATFYKAAAVMIGCAAESIALDIRDALVSKLNALEVSLSLQTVI